MGANCRGLPGSQLPDRAENQEQILVKLNYTQRGNLDPAVGTRRLIVIAQDKHAHLGAVLAATRLTFTPGVLPHTSPLQRTIETTVPPPPDPEEGVVTPAGALRRNAIVRG